MTETKPEAGVEAEIEPEAKPEPEVEPKPEPEVEPKPEPEVKPEVKIIRGDTGADASVRGVVHARVRASGSRSERVGPVLVDEHERGHALHLIGENPFEQPTLLALAGRRVRVSGTWRNGVIRVAREHLYIEPEAGEPGEPGEPRTTGVAGEPGEPRTASEPGEPGEPAPHRPLAPRSDP